MMDLGFIGFKKDYNAKKSFIPHRSSKNLPLTTLQKEENKAIAKDRIRVEHAIGGMKRFRILSDRLRVHSIELYEDLLEVCTGLCNFQIHCNSMT